MATWHLGILEENYHHICIHQTQFGYKLKFITQNGNKYWQKVLQQVLNGFKQKLVAMGYGPLHNAVHILLLEFCSEMTSQ